MTLILPSWMRRAACSRRRLRMNSPVEMPVISFILRCSWARLMPTSAVRRSTLKSGSDRLALMVFMMRSIRASLLPFTSTFSILSSCRCAPVNLPLRRRTLSMRLSMRMCSSSMLKGLARKASAPFLSPSRRSLTSAFDVSRMTGMSLMLGLPFSCLSMEMPSISGIITSLTTKS